MEARMFFSLHPTVQITRTVLFPRNLEASFFCFFSIIWYNRSLSSPTLVSISVEIMDWMITWMQCFSLVINHNRNTVNKSHEIWTHINKGKEGLWIIWGNLCKEREEEKLALSEERGQIHILILKLNCYYNYLRLAFSCVSQDEALFSFPLISCTFCSSWALLLFLCFSHF